MTTARKYRATEPEAEFEPGSRGRVLRNHLGITRVRDNHEAESQALELAQEVSLDRFRVDHRFTADDVCALQALHAGLAPLSFASLAGRGRRRYIHGIHAAVGRDYAPLASVFERVIERSRRRGVSSTQ